LLAFFDKRMLHIKAYTIESAAIEIRIFI